MYDSTSGRRHVVPIDGSIGNMPVCFSDAVNIGRTGDKSVKKNLRCKVLERDMMVIRENYHSTVLAIGERIGHNRCLAAVNSSLFDNRRGEFRCRGAHPLGTKRACLFGFFDV